MKIRVLATVVVLLLASCVSAPPKFLSSDLATAHTRQQKLDLYRSLEAEIRSKPSAKTAAAYQKLLIELGASLGNDEASNIKSTIGSSKVLAGFVPISVVRDSWKAAEPISTWDRSQYDLLIAELRQYQSLTEKVIADEQLLLRKFESGFDPVSRVETLGRIDLLYGDSAEATKAYKAAYDHTRNDLSVVAESSMQKMDYGAALAASESLKRLDPQYPNIDGLISNARTGLDTGKFRELLVNGDIEGAYTTFLEVTKRQMAPFEKRDFLGPSHNLAKYFGSNAGVLTRNAQYAGAYNSMKREMFIREWMNEPSQLDSSTIKQFADAMFNLSTAANARDLFGLEYGYLLLTEEFEPAYTTLEIRKRDAEDTVYNNAIRRVGSVTINSAGPSGQKIASQVATGVRQNLMENIPEDVKIVEREKLEDVMNERRMNNEITKFDEDYEELEAADYLIEGELLTADVAEDIKSVKNKMRVVTGLEEVENPAYKNWIKVKGVRKADHPDAPAQTIKRDVLEDIELTIEEHRKFGEVGVTYRVIDTTSAELVHSESISKNMQISDQTREGVNYGQFKQEAKIAELPANIEIYRQLVDQVVEEMSLGLIKFLANPDGNYFGQCEQLALDEEYIKAAELCAKAVVLRKYKSFENAQSIKMLKLLSLNSGMRPD